MERIIISFTSYPKRICTINKVLDSIINQTVKADKIILYLSLLEFENFNDMPDLREYEKFGFEICWHKENLVSHKKWFYAFSKYPNDIVITIDDDTIYKDTMIEKLIKYHKIYPDAVIGRRAHLIVCNMDGEIAPYLNWYGECERYVGIPRMDLLLTGNAGILYPPNIFGKEIFDQEVFMKKCQYGDDLWLKIMELYYEVPVVLAEKYCEDGVIREYQSDSLCALQNAGKGNDKQLEDLLKYYPKTYNRNKMLLDCIFSSGKVYKYEVPKLEKEKMETVFKELLEKILTFNEILIYGAGDIGNKVYNLIRKNNRTIKCFIVNDISSNVSNIDGISVKNFREFIQSDEKIIVALANRSEAMEVQFALRKAGVSKERIVLLNDLEISVLRNSYLDYFNSAAYWEKRYSMGGNSGSGSYNRLAEFKAKILNEFVAQNRINTVIEWGCGDGNQLSKACYPNYVGFDVSQKAIEICQKKFEQDITKKFIWCGKPGFETDIKAELAISLDVIFHLIEDDVYDLYMKRLFTSSIKYVCIYSSNYEERVAIHVKHRKFEDWINTNLGNEWELKKIIKNPYSYMKENPDNTTPSDFYFFKKQKY